MGDEDDPETRGWPWIRLGYAYDWENPRNLVGLSEFVLCIDPNRNGGEAVVFLVRAIEAETADWSRCFSGRN